MRLVDEAELAKEKRAAMTGKDIAIAYGVFLVAALLFSVISGGGMIDISITLADLLSGNLSAMLGGGSGKGVFLVLLATATIAVPYFWKHRFAPLAFIVPLLFTLYAFWPIYRQHREQQQAREAMGEFGQMIGQVAQQMSANSGGLFENIGFGAYVVFAAAAYLACKGVVRFLGRS